MNSACSSVSSQMRPPPSGFTGRAVTQFPKRFHLEQLQFHLPVAQDPPWKGNQKSMEASPLYSHLPIPQARTAWLQTWGHAAALIRMRKKHAWNLPDSVPAAWPAPLHGNPFTVAFESFWWSEDVSRMIVYGTRVNIVALPQSAFYGRGDYNKDRKRL